MAEESKAKRRLGPKKKTETLRQRTERVTTESQKTTKVRKIRKTAHTVSRPFRAAHRIGKKEYYLPMPDNRFGRFMNKRRSWVPGFFKQAWIEVRKVQWPDARTTARLTFAVFVFSLIFGTLVTVVDYGLDKVFRKVFID